MAANLFLLSNFGVTANSAHTNEVHTSASLVRQALHCYKALPGAVVHFATVCSSWVLINRATSQRSDANPLGGSRPYVLRANVMVARTALLMLAAVCLDLHCILEQPASSLMFKHPRIVQILDLGANGMPAFKRITTYMGSFGAATPKMTALLGTPSWLSKLARSFKLKFTRRIQTPAVVTRRVVRGRHCYTGVLKAPALGYRPVSLSKASVNRRRPVGALSRGFGAGKLACPLPSHSARSAGCNPCLG